MKKYQIDPEEIYHQRRDNTNFMLAVAFVVVVTGCAAIIYVTSILERLMY
jgi:hypothetical protein